MTEQLIIIQLRRKSDVQAARIAGFTKNHFMVEMYFLGKWRAVGFYTHCQVFHGLAEKRVKYLLKTNAGGTVPNAIVWQEDIL